MEKISFLDGAYTEYSLTMKSTTEMHKLINSIIDYFIKNVKISSEKIEIELYLPQSTNTLSTVDFLNTLFTNEFENIKMLTTQKDVCIFSKKFNLNDKKLDWELHFNQPDERPSVLLIFK